MPSHHETRNVPYSADQMYALVADVASYPQFLPWNSAARIRSRRPVQGPDGAGEVMEADLVISFKVFRERFGSRVTLWPGPRRIETEYLDGPFRHMQSTWIFRDVEGGCEITFDVDFEFRNALLQGIIGIVFNDAMLRVVRAFERRAGGALRVAGADGCGQDVTLMRATRNRSIAPGNRRERGALAAPVTRN